jgi:hypothetical protein
MRRMLFVLFLLMPFVAEGSHFGDFYVVPVAGHTPGAGGSMWQSDLVIHNFQTTPVTIEIGLVDSGLGLADNFFPVMVNGAATVTVPAGSTRLLPDVLRDHRGRAMSLGALLVGGDQPFALSSRVYNADGPPMGIGDIVPAAQDFLTMPEQRAVIPGLTVSADFRTNLGFVAAAAAGAPLVVELSLVNANGASLGAQTFTIPAGSVTHMQMSSTALTNVPFDVATAILRIVSGSGNVSGYGSVVDNRSNHVMFVGSGFPATTTQQESVFASFLSALR